MNINDLTVEELIAKLKRAPLDSFVRPELDEDGRVVLVIETRAQRAQRLAPLAQRTGSYFGDDP